MHLRETHKHTYKENAPERDTHTRKMNLRGRGEKRRGDAGEGEPFSHSILNEGPVY